MHLRPVARPDDLPAIEALVVAVTAADGHAPLGEHKYLDLLHAEFERITGFVGEMDGIGIVAYVAATPTQEAGTWAAEFAVHPHHRDDLRSCVEHVVEWVRSSGGSRIRVWAYRPEFSDALESAGFVLERQLHQQTRNLPIEAGRVLIPGLALRPFEPGRDDLAWLELNALAFQGHPENGAWDREVLADRMAQGWFDPGGFLMLWDDRSLAGFCWTKMVDQVTGEIYVLAVDPQRQGRGLGAYLLEEGIRAIQSRGGERVILYVDSENERGLRLYRRFGFSTDHTDRSYLLELG